MHKALPWKNLILCLCVFIMAGCASGNQGQSVGRAIDTTHLRDIQKGITKSQIRDWFGEPNSTGFSDKKDDQGQPVAESWTYSYAWSDGNKSESQTLIIVFNKDGKVINRAYNEK